MKILFLLFPLFVCAEILLLSNFDEKKLGDLNNYVMSEKLDGIRGVWDGKKLKTRNSNTISVPSFFTQNFPNFALDGELFSKRADFENISSIVASQDENAWHELSYNVFDVPNACKEFNLKPCTLLARLQVLETYLQKHPSKFLKIIPQYKVISKENLKEFYDFVIKNKGEGLVIRRNDIDYERKRSNNAFKLKPYEDAECQVKEHIKGKGKYKNQLGSILCQTPKGQIIKIGSGFSDEERQNPPPINSIITYKFNGLTKNQIPRFPVFLRVRKE